MGVFRNRVMLLTVTFLLQMVFILTKQAPIGSPLPWGKIKEIAQRGRLFGLVRNVSRESKLEW